MVNGAPIFLKKDKNWRLKIENWRPVSVLTISSKILERITQKQFTDYIGKLYFALNETDNCNIADDALFIRFWLRP